MWRCYRNHMKQAAFNHNQQNLQHSQAINNANGLVGKGQQPKKSFAKEMNQLQNANSLMAGEEVLPGQEMLAQNQQPLTAEGEVKKFRNAIETAFAEQGISYDSLPPEIQEKLAILKALSKTLWRRIIPHT